MVPSAVLSQAMVDLLAADAGTLAPVANGNHIHLIVAPFTPGPTTDFTTLTEASWTGYAPLEAGTGTQQTFTDPANSLRNIQLLEPAGGWHFPCTATPSPAQTVYGWCLTDDADTVTLGSGLLPAPVTINAAGQAVDLPYLRFTFLNTSPF